MALGEGEEINCHGEGIALLICKGLGAWIKAWSGIFKEKKDQRSGKSRPKAEMENLSLSLKDLSGNSEVIEIMANILLHHGQREVRLL